MESNPVGAELASARKNVPVETRDLASRVEKLERESGYWRRMAMRLYGVSVALGAGFILMFALAATKPAGVQDVIRAKKLEIVDDKGNTRISLRVDPNFEALSLIDQKGYLRAMLSVEAAGPALWLGDEKGTSRAALSVGHANGEGLWLYDEKGGRRAVLQVNPWPGLMLFNENGMARASLSVVADWPVLKLLDKDTKVIWQAPPKK